MREIITIQIGGCGNAIGSQFWSTISEEHLISKEGKYTGDVNNKMDRERIYRADTYFDESKENKFIPRAILTSVNAKYSNESPLNDIKASSIGNLFNANNYVYGANAMRESQYGEQLPFDKFDSLCSETCDDLMDAIRKEMEKCSCAQGFQIYHSLAGFCGSFLTEKVLQNHYNDKEIVTHTVCDSNIQSMEAFNAISCLDRLISTANQCYVYQNDRIKKICQDSLKMDADKIEYNTINWIISQAVSGVTASLRFDCNLNKSLRRISMNLVSFMRLHFLSVNMAPLVAKRESYKNVKQSVDDLTNSLWNKQNFLNDFGMNNGKYLATTSLYRGEFEADIYEQQPAAKDEFVNWIPAQNKKDEITVSMNEDCQISATNIANHTGIKHIFEGIQAKFAKFSKGKGYSDYYKDHMNYGKSVRDLIAEYQEKQDAVFKGYDDEDSDDYNDTGDDNDDDDDDYSDDDDCDDDDFF